MILYMKRWFPARARARAVAWFMTANPLAGIVGSPISGALLGLTGKGLSGWQWMFLMEGIPAILLGAVVLWVLSDRPEEATWLKGEERAWLLDKLAGEQQAESRLKQGSFWQVLIAPRIWMLSLVYFGVSTTMYGVTFWLPSLIQSLSGLGNLADEPGCRSSVCSGDHRNGAGRNALGSYRGAALAHGASRVLRSGGFGSGSLWQSAGAGDCWRRTGDGWGRGHGGTFLGDGDHAHGRPSGSRWNRDD